MYILETKDLSKYYKRTHALEHVNMHIQKGDIYGFVGKNGAGKTTLIRVITGVAEKTSGTFSLFGETDEKKLIKLRAKMAAVVENPALNLTMNAYDNLRCQCTLLGIKEKINEVIGLAMKRVDLEPLLISKRKKVKNFSLGMKQRLGIAMALISNPEFLVLDEPNNGLDPEGIRDMRELLLRLNKEEGVTILVSSHILTELSKLATTYGFIHKGALIKEISAHDLEKECRKAVVFKVEKPEDTKKILNNAGYKDVVALEGGVKVYDVVSISKIVTLLASKEIDVKNIVEENEDLEAYFINMIGGNKHE